MKYAPILALLLALAWQGNAYAQEDEAQNLYLILSPFNATRVEPADKGFELTFSTAMPGQGWQLTLDKGGAPEDGAINLYMTLQRGENAERSVQVKAATGELTVGSWPVNIHWRKPGGEYRLRAVYLLFARKYGQDEPQPGVKADTATLADASILGGERKTGVRLQRDKGGKFELQVTLGTPYDKLKLELDKFEKPDRNNVMQAWISCEDPGERVRPAVTGWAQTSLKLGKLKPGTYVCEIHYAPYPKRGHSLTLRALLSTDKPLMPEDSPVTQDGKQVEAAHTPLWQPPTADGAWAGSARIVRGTKTLKLQSPSVYHPAWSLRLGDYDSIDSFNVDEEGRAIELQVGLIDEDTRRSKKPEQPVQLLPRLAAGDWRLEVWRKQGDGYTLDCCRALVVEAETDEYALGSLGGADNMRLQAGERPDDVLLSDGGEFSLETCWLLGAYQGNPKLAKVESEGGVFRLKVHIADDKSGKGKPNREQPLKAELGKLRAGHHRIELLVKNGDGEYACQRVIWLEAKP
ncbi:MAG: hypothetical protein M5U25_12940 [Planctomycetota bacterium]|nr:hypothetical protein [Planctomycetota bacterium]